MTENRASWRHTRRVIHDGGFLKNREDVHVLNSVDDEYNRDFMAAADILYYAKGFSPADALDRAQLFAALKIQHSGGAKGFPSESEREYIELNN